MAELLGVVASGISIASIAIQVSDSVFKLKEFWDTVKSAPEDIKNLIDEIQTLSLILSDVGNSTTPDELTLVGQESAKKCLDLCQKGSHILEGVLREIDGNLGKGKRTGGFKAAMKKGTIDKLRDRLRSAQFMLMLSSQTYYEALQRRRTEIQQQWSEAHTKELVELKASVHRSEGIILSLREAKSSATSSTSSDDSLLPREGTEAVSSTSTRRKKLKRRWDTISSAAIRQKEFRGRISAPSWLLFTNTLDICFSRAVPGWKFSMTAYRVVHGDSELSRCICAGDVQALRALFEQRKASPFDKVGDWWWNLSILELAAHHGRTEICQLILEEGGGSNNLGISSAIELVIWHGDMVAPNESSAKTVRLLSQANDDYDPVDIFLDHYNRDSYRIRWQTWFEPSLLYWLLQRSSVQIQDLSPRLLMDFVINICSRDHQYHAGTLARILLEGRMVTSSLISIREEWSMWRGRPGQSLIHCLARQLGHIFRKSPPETREQLLHEHWDPESWPSKTDHWRKFTPLQNLLGLVHEAVMAGLGLDSLTCLDSNRVTPLLLVFHGFIWTGFPANGDGLQLRSFGDPLIPIKMWLRLLHTSGVDLVKYGRREQRRQAGMCLEKEWWEWIVLPEKEEEIVYRFLGFDYGPEPADWKFRITAENARFWDALTYFSEFWDMIDHPERAMPGAWSDEFDDDLVTDSSDEYSSDTLSLEESEEGSEDEA